MPPEPDDDLVDDADLDEELPPLEDDELPPGEDDEDPPEDQDDDEDLDLSDEDEPAPAERSAHDQGQRGQGRGDRRIQTLNRELRQTQAELARIRDGQSAGQSQDQRRRAEEAQAAERARYDMMSPEERIEYRLQQMDQRQTAELQRVRFETADNADRQAFADLCKTSNSAARLAARVEQELKKLRDQGTNVPRRTILAVLIGEKALSGAPRATGRQQRRAEEQRQRQSAKPGSRASRSDAPSQDRRSSSDREARNKRLEDQSF